MTRSLSRLVAAALCAPLILAGCGSSTSREGGEPLVTISESPTATPTSPAPAYTAEAPPVPAESSTQSYGPLPDAASIEFETCSTPEKATDHVGNEFTVTVCGASSGEAVSFYEFDSSQYPGMASEYTEVTHIASTWGVAASTEGTLQTIVSNLGAAGY